MNNENDRQFDRYVCVYLFDELVGEDESLALLFFCGSLSDPEEHLCVRVQQEHIL